MKSKYLGIAVVAILLFLMTPISVISVISPMNMEVVHSVIPQSEFVITLDEGEEVIWIADHVTREDDVAYVTMKTTCYGAEGSEGELQMTPSYQPNPPEVAGYPYNVTHCITARGFFGRILFFIAARGWIRFNWVGKCTHVIPTSFYASFSFRYWKAEFLVRSWEKGEHYGESIADGSFEDIYKDRYINVHAYAGYDWYDGMYGGGYVDWGD